MKDEKEDQEALGKLSGESKSNKPSYSSPVSEQEYRDLYQISELLKTKSENSPGMPRLSHSKESQSLRQWARYTGLGFQMLFLMVLPGLAGWWLDHTFELEPFGLLAGLLIGMVLGIYSVIAAAQRMEQNQNNRAKTNQKKI